MLKSNNCFKFEPLSYWSQANCADNLKRETDNVAGIDGVKVEICSAYTIKRDVKQDWSREEPLNEKSEPDETKEQTEEIAKWLKRKYQIERSIAKQLAFHLIELYKHLLQLKFGKASDSLNSGVLHGRNIVEQLDKSSSVDNINLEIAEIDKIVEHVESSIVPKLGSIGIWQSAARELSIHIPEIASFFCQKRQSIDVSFDFSKHQKLKEKYSQSESQIELSGLEEKIETFLLNFTQREVSAIFERLEYNLLTLEDLDEMLGLKKENDLKPIPKTESRLVDAIWAIPTSAAISSASNAQIRGDLWRKDDNGIAYFKHQAKSNPNNYIEHYISNPGDIEILPWEQAEQIINKFGFNTVKLHLIFAAYTMTQPTPWSGKFTLKASDIIKYLGWDKRTDLPVHSKLDEIAKNAFVLDCLLVKSVWVEGRNKKGQINASTPTGRMWNVVIDRRGQLNTEGKVEQPEEVYITVQPGLIFHSFLNKAGSRMREALYQFGYLAQDILQIDPYHNELALRLAIHLTMDSRVHPAGTYRVETLLRHILPHAKVDKARSDTRRGYDLKQRWDNALKLLINIGWQIQFDESYPPWLQPGNKTKKPADARKMKIIEWLLSAKITIQPPAPIPELLVRKVRSKPKAKKQKQIVAIGITSDQIRQGRNAKGWSQRKLAGWLGVTQTLVGYWEKGKRTPSEKMERKLRELLEVTD